MFEITNGDKHINNKYYINFTYKSTPKNTLHIQTNYTAKKYDCKIYIIYLNLIDFLQSNRIRMTDESTIKWGYILSTNCTIFIHEYISTQSGVIQI